MRRAAVAALVDRTAARLSEYGFFFEFDGTLAQIQQDPESVQPVPGEKSTANNTLTFPISYQ